MPIKPDRESQRPRKGDPKPPARTFAELLSHQWQILDSNGNQIVSFTPGEGPPSGDELASFIMASLDHVSAEVTEAVEPFVERTKQFLRMLEGKDFDFDKKSELVLKIRGALDWLHISLLCPDCGLPARIRCAKAGGTEHGYIYFDHTSKGKTTSHWGSRAFPALAIAPVESVVQVKNS